MTLIANQTLAETQAKHNLVGNLVALDHTQPELRQWVADQVLNHEWVFGRDKSLTAMDEFGQWWAGCSLPQRMAEASLGKLEIKGAVGCFLAPVHAMQLRVALDRLRPEQAIVAIVPEMRDLAMILHCQDLSREIASHRLWFAAGAAWDVALCDLFDRQPGLATPTQFIRTPETDPQLIQEMIATAQSIFADSSSMRAEKLQSMNQPDIRVGGARVPLCVVAPSRFRLWNDLGEAMIRLFDNSTEIEAVKFDADDPLCSSPAALVNTARRCSAILTANTSRTDLPGLMPESIPWITWVAGSRIPGSALAGPDDHLILSDSKLMPAATRVGWRATNVHTGGWPANAVAQSNATNGMLAIIVDTIPLDTPAELIEYSSHTILWESIRRELAGNPMSLVDVAAFLSERMKRAGVSEEGFSMARFADKLILPAYQQGLARLLLEAKIPVRLFGEGWNAIPEFATYAAGPIRSREHLHDVLGTSSAVVHVWPTNLAHPIESIGKPLIRRGVGGTGAFITQARKALNGILARPMLTEPPLDSDLILKILRSTSACSQATI